SEETYHYQHYNRADYRFCRSPDYFTGYDFFGIERSCHHGVKCLLVIHSNKRAERVFEKRVVHNIDRHKRRSDKTQIRRLYRPIADRADHAAKTDSKGQKIKKRLQKRRQKVDLPTFLINSKIPLPDPHKTGGNINVHSRSSRPVNFRKTSSRVAERNMQLLWVKRSQISR